MARKQVVIRHIIRKLTRYLHVYMSNKKPYRNKISKRKYIYYLHHHFYTYTIHKCFIAGRQRQSDWFWMQRENNYFLLSFLYCNGKSNKTLSLQKNYRIEKKRTEQANFFCSFRVAACGGSLVERRFQDMDTFFFLLKCNKLSSDIFCGYGCNITMRYKYNLVSLMQ